MTIKILSWNVNGIRAVNNKEKKKIQGITFSDWVLKEDADIICVQETKAHPDQLTGENANLISLGEYHSYFSSAEKKGYSGVAVYSKIKPIEVMHEIGSSELDKEGRTLILDFGSFVLFNIYYPNGKGSPARLKYKMDFYDAFLKRAEEFKNDGKTVVICGDFNTAHKEIDLARPKENSKVSGFLPVERDWMDEFVNCGFEPAWILIKKAAVADWQIRDRERDPHNELSDQIIFPDLLSAEISSTNNLIDFRANGFKLHGSGGDHNGDQVTFIYLAFAHHPTVTSTGVPCTAALINY